MKITKEKIIQLTAGWISGILTVFFFIKMQSIHKEKNIYLAELKNLDVRMKWLSNEMIQINGSRIRI